MSYQSSALVIDESDEKPRVNLNGDLAAIRFPGDFSILLAGSMTPAKQAAYLRDLAEQVADLAIQVERAAAGSAA